MPRAVSSAASASSPATRSESSLSITSAATVLPAKLTDVASGAFHTDEKLVLARTAVPSRRTSADTAPARAVEVVIVQA